MAEVNYVWGSERPASRRERLKRQIAATEALKVKAAEAYARTLAEIEAAESVRLADLEEVEVMTHGGAAPYDRSREADPKIASRPRVENTQAVYGRGAKLKRSTLPTTVIAVGEGSLHIRKGAKAAGRKRATKGKARSVAPEATARDSAVSDVVDRVDMVLPGVSAAVAPESEIVLPAAEADRGALAEPDPDLEPVAEPEPEPLPLPPPVPLAAMGQEVGFVLGDTDALTAEVEVSSFVDKVVDLFSPEVEQERLRRADPARLPKGYDPTWADHWQEDPNAHHPEMYAEFITFGAAIDKAPEDLTDAEARLLLGPVLFGLPYDYHENPAKYEGVKLRPVFSREQDVSEFLWQGEIARAGGTLQQIAIKYKDNVDLRREVERARRRMWPFALRRRDAIKDLMTAVAVGEMSFAPASSAQADLDRSVQWWVFRHADHDWLVTSGREDWKIYAWRMLDKLPWPAGLSRIELLERFGAGMKPTDVPNLSSQGQPPKWLVPDHKWIYGPDYMPFTVRGEPYDLKIPRSVRGGDLVASPDLPLRVPVRRREIGKKPRG